MKFSCLVLANNLSILSVFKNKGFLFFIFLSTYFGSFAQVYGDFPYFQSFETTSKPAEVSLPIGALPNSAKFTSTGLELTQSENYTFGSVVINDKKFNSDVGINISFEYSIYGGTGADGLLFFLFDAATNPVKIGSVGAGLGYNFRRSNNTYTIGREIGRLEGLTGAYLGIALDSYGNFKTRTFTPYERFNGIPFMDQLNKEYWGSYYKSHVTLRGGKGTHIDDKGKGIGFTGYPVLISKSTLSYKDNSVFFGGATLDTKNGNYFGFYQNTAEGFNLRSGVFTKSPNDLGFRKVFIEILPNILGGVFISVRIQHGGMITTVIDHYWYESELFYIENANVKPTDFTFVGETQDFDTKHLLKCPTPSQFKIGFAAATGGANDIHKIWNLEVTLPYSAEAEEDVLTTCFNNKISILPLKNDLAYSGPITGAPTASPDNIDYDQFHFVNDDGSKTVNPFVLVKSFGTFTYNASNGEVVFVPANGFVGKASALYSIKGKLYPVGTFQPYGEEALRSVPTKIIVNVKNCGTLVNPSIPSKSY